MRRESREALLYTLLIADIRIYFAEESKLRTIESGNVQSCLAHECKQAHGFKRYCLTAGVGTCNYEQIEIISESYVDGNRCLGIKERVTCFS